MASGPSTSGQGSGESMECTWWVSRQSGSGVGVSQGIQMPVSWTCLAAEHHAGAAVQGTSGQSNASSDRTIDSQSRRLQQCSTSVQELSQTFSTKTSISRNSAPASSPKSWPLTRRQRDSEFVKTTWPVWLKSLSSFITSSAEMSLGSTRSTLSQNKNLRHGWPGMIGDQPRPCAPGVSGVPCWSASWTEQVVFTMNSSKEQSTGTSTCTFLGISESA